MTITYFNERAERVIAFIEKLTVPSGKRAGLPFELDPFQREFIYAVYAPHVFDDEDEEFKRVVVNAILSIARKNGKTALIACLVLVHLVGPEAELNNEIYSAANDREQAAQVFNYCKQIIDATPALKGFVFPVPSTKTIACFGNGSSYKALSREAGTKHGSNPGLVIYDELAQAADMELFTVLDSSMGARKEPLMMVIGTQSKDPQHILSQMIDDGLSADDPTIVCHLHAVPMPEDGEEIDLYDEELWKLANPALGSFLYTAYVRKKAARAARLPSFENSFMNLHLNMRVDATPSLISRSEWMACYDEDCTLHEGEDIYIGLDLSSKIDLTALVAISARDGDRIVPWFWKPKEYLKEHQKRDRAPYDKWVKEKYLTVVPGKVVDYEHIAIQLVYLMTHFNILGLAFDRWRIDILMKEMERHDIEMYEGELGEGEGIRLVPWGQGFKDMSPAIEEFEESVINNLLKHNGNPVLTWNFSNAVAVSDPSDNRKLDKQKARFRIDGAVATVMAKGLKSRDMIDDDGDIDDFLNDPVNVGAK